jgi:hypothetical protein
VKVGELAKQLKVKFDTVPEGRGDAALDLRIPDRQVRRPRRYRASGTISLRDVSTGRSRCPN